MSKSPVGSICRSVALTIIETAAIFAVPRAVLPVLIFVAAEYLLTEETVAVSPRQFFLVGIAAPTAFGPPTVWYFVYSWATVEFETVVAMLAISPFVGLQRYFS